jgi:hypothetical protein
MATVDRDFRVKNGLNVGSGGTFGGTVTVATPTENSHAATKLYVDSAISGVSLPVSATDPESPSNGDMYFNTVTQHISVYYNNQWIQIATLDDSEQLPQHIHDTAIDGTGFIASRFYDAGFYNSAHATSASGGFYNTASWLSTWDAGTPVDNYN